MEKNMILEKLMGFINKYSKTINIDPDADIYSLGLRNSLFAMQLITFIEESFNVTVSNEALVDGSLKTVNNIILYILNYSE